MTDEPTNPEARDVHDEWPHAKIRYTDLWKEVRFRVAIGPRNGSIVAFSPDSPRVAV